MHLYLRLSDEQRELLLEKKNTREFVKMEIKIKNLTKIYKNIKVLDNVSLEIHNGVFGLLGENGAGKTTLMEIISTLLPFDDGEIEVAGLNVKRTT